MIMLIYTVVLFGSTAVALWRGGRPERFAAMVLFAASFASPLAQSRMFETVEAGVLALDLTVLMVLAAIGLLSDRFWPLWAAGFQSVSTAIHLARWADPGVWPPAYAWAEAIWAYPIQAALLIGTLREAAPKRP